VLPGLIILLTATAGAIRAASANASNGAIAIRGFIRGWPVVGREEIEHAVHLGFQLAQAFVLMLQSLDDAFLGGDGRGKGEQNRKANQRSHWSFSNQVEGDFCEHASRDKADRADDKIVHELEFQVFPKSRHLLSFPSFSLTLPASLLLQFGHASFQGAYVVVDAHQVRFRGRVQALHDRKAFLDARIFAHDDFHICPINHAADAISRTTNTMAVAA